MMKSYIAPNALLISPDDTDFLTTSLLWQGDGDEDSYTLPGFGWLKL